MKQIASGWIAWREGGYAASEREKSRDSVVVKYNWMKFEDKQKYIKKIQHMLSEKGYKLGSVPNLGMCYLKTQLSNKEVIFT